MVRLMNPKSDEIIYGPPLPRMRWPEVDDRHHHASRGGPPNTVMVGTVLTPSDGFLVALSSTERPATSEPNQATPSGVWFKGSYLQLRGERDYRDLYCAQPSTAFMSHIGKELLLVVNYSLPYRGGLQVLALPKGAKVTITLSDVENIRTTASDTGAAVRRVEH